MILRKIHKIKSCAPYCIYKNLLFLKFYKFYALVVDSSVLVLIISGIARCRLISRTFSKQVVADFIKN